MTELCRSRVSLPPCWAGSVTPLASQRFAFTDVVEASNVVSPRTSWRRPFSSRPLPKVPLTGVASEGVRQTQCSVPFEFLISFGTLGGVQLSVVGGVLMQCLHLT